MNATPGTILLVHGLWYGSWAMRYLASRFKKDGFRTRLFDYQPTAAPLDHQARQLKLHADSLTGQVHFIGHSYGGLVILRMLQAFDRTPPARAVLLGSPLNGSKVAARLCGLPGGQILLRQAEPGLIGGCADIPDSREVGMIAGSRPIGLGLALGRPGEASDGTVAVSETRAAGLADHLVLPVTHFSLVTSRQVAGQATCFFTRGRFNHAGQDSN